MLLCYIILACMISYVFVCSIENQLGVFEQRHHIVNRWKTDSQEFLEARRSHFNEKQQSLYRSIRAAIVKRQYLLKLKAKYAGMQYTCYNSLYYNYCV